MAKRTATFVDEFRQQVKDCGISRYRIWKDTGIDQAALSRFVRGEAFISVEAINTLAGYLNLHVTKGQ